MGIKGLHKGLAFCTNKNANMRDFSGKAIAVDASSWLHRSVYSVSEKYVETTESGRLDPSCVRVSSKYISSRCGELLQSFQIRKIFLVMDGKRCPLKVVTNDDREQRRQQNLKEARDYKRRGWRDKAEEKYKMCIKIRDELTHAVMKEVKKSFARDDRVQFVWSPYEADAQLAKLCVDHVADAVITEDSDILVYSAAAHFAFPVLFKLDRGTGRCDSICMDWLLSPPPDQATTSSKAASALELLLKNLGSRQARRPGFGVRLFVQACVLAGCDYAPNNLSGVGLVSAFKLIRDIAFRNDSVRFAKALESLPRKAKQGIDIKEYEVTLAKSESVFYYHPVRHLDGSIRPLSEPRASNDENGEEHHFSDHFPFMKRFEDDWSFLGKMQGSPNDVPPPPPPPVTESKMPERPNDIPPPVTEIVVPGDSRKKQSHSKTQPTIKSTHHVHKKVENPYKRSRKATMDKYQPALQEISPNIPATNPFSVFAKMDDIKPALATGTLKYLQKQEDVRFVKRRFSPDKDNTRFNKNSKMPIQKRNFSSHRQVFGEYARDHQEKLNSNKTLQSACSQEISHAENGGFDAACQFEYDVPDETNIVSSRRTTVGKTDNDWLSDRITYSESPLRGVPLPTESLRQENTECFDLTGSDSGHAGLCERGNVEVLLEYTESAIHSNEAEGFGERLHPTDRKSEYNFESFDSSQQDFDTEPKPTHTKKTSVEVYSDSEKGTECNLEHYEWSRPDLDIDPQQTLRSERSLIGLGTKTDRVIEFEPRSYVPSQNNIGIDPKQINTEKQGEHNPRYYDSLRPDLCIDPNQKQTSGFSTDFSHGARSATERYSEYNPECYDSSRPNLENDPKLTVTSELSEIAFGTRSKHFKNDRSRRVTLDPTEIDDASLGDGQSGPTSFKAIYQSGLGRDKVDTVTPQAKRSDLNDEIIESPLDFDDHPASASFFKEPLGKRLSGQFSIAGDRYSSVASHKPRRGGPLENAFKRQEQLSSQDSSSRSWRNSSIVRSSNGSLLGGKKKVNSLTSYFQPVKKKRAVFSQLHIDTGENDEDFLWNTL